MSKAEQPPFKRGEWVRCMHGLFRVLRCVERSQPLGDDEPSNRFIGAVPAGRMVMYVDLTGRGEHWASDCRRASVRELRAESKRLAARAAALAKAADAVSAKKGAGR